MASCSYLHTGKAKIAGQTLAINASFATEAIFLANSLDVSELHCAEIIEGLMRNDPNLVPDQRIEKAIHIFHSRRSTLLATLNLILTGSKEEEASGRGDLLKSFAASQLFGGEPLALSGGRRGALGEKLLEEMDKVGRTSAKVASTIRDAKSDTNLKGILIL